MVKSRASWVCSAMLGALGAFENAGAGGQPVDASDPAVSSEAFVAWARSHAIPLRADDSAGSLRQSDDMAQLRNIVGTARIVALGEPAHGAHEPLAFRNRLFQYLVENLQFTAIALESGLCESKRVQEFVTGGAGNAAQITRDGLSWGFGKFGENVELLRWIRAYNEDRMHKHKVNFYGIDMCGGDEAGFPHARIALDTALSYLLRLSPDSVPRARKSIGLLINKFTDERYRSLSRSQQDDFSAAIGELLRFFERNREALIIASSRFEYEWMRRELIVARELERAFRIWPPDEPGKILPAGLYKVANLRDATMAENVRWALQREGYAGRLLVFAHNAHIMSAPVSGGIWDVFPRSPKTMGQHLRAMFDKNLFIIGASSQESAPSFPVATPDPGGIDEALAAVGIAHFLLDLRSGRSDPPVAVWLAQLHPLRANFGTELLLKPIDAFDTLVFTRRLTAAVPNSGRD